MHPNAWECKEKPGSGSGMPRIGRQLRPPRGMDARSQDPANAGAGMDGDDGA